MKHQVLGFAQSIFCLGKRPWLKTQNLGEIFWLMLTLSIMAHHQLSSHNIPQPKALPLSDCSPQQLELIPSIGPQLARALLDHREGKLSSIKGIGPQREALLLNYITTSP